MRVDEPPRYNLRFELDIPLVRDSSRAPSENAIEHYQVALVRLGAASDMVVARAQLFRVCPCSGEDTMLAAEEIGCEYLERVCAEALVEDTRIAPRLEAVFPHDAVTEVHVLTGLDFIAAEDEDPCLRVLFVRAIIEYISRGFELLFVEDDPELFPMWQRTIGARRFGDFIVAAASYRLPELGALRDTSMHH